MSLKKLFLFVLTIALAVSCKKKTTETDNLFKFRDYISYTTSGRTSVASPIQINLTTPVEGWETGQIITDNIVRITPHVEGQLTVANNHALLFKPDEYLEADTEYTVFVKLNSIYKNIPSGYEDYTFQFKTITPSFNIETNSLQSYSKTWQYLEGVIKSADVMPLKDAKTLVKASQNGKTLPTKF